MDTSEEFRSLLNKLVNMTPFERPELESEHGEVWDTQELQRDFEVLGFMAPFVVVIRKADRQKGSLMFQHSPRFYYDFEPDKPLEVVR